MLLGILAASILGYALTGKGVDHIHMERSKYKMLCVSFQNVIK